MMPAMTAPTVSAKTKRQSVWGAVVIVRAAVIKSVAVVGTAIIASAIVSTPVAASSVVTFAAASVVPTAVAPMTATVSTTSLSGICNYQRRDRNSSDRKHSNYIHNVIVDSQTD